MARSVKRSFGFAGFGAPFLMVVALAACGGDDDSSLGTEVEIKPSSFVTTPVTTTPPTAAPGEAPTGQPGETTPGTQVHVVQQGEFLSGIAADYEVDMEEIADFNAWPEGVNHPLFPDDQVKIPPGAVIPSPDDEDEGDESDEETDSTDEDSGDEDETETTEESDLELCPNGEPQGHYTIQSTDLTRVGVAERLNVTVAQLDEANANTPGYSGFFPGLEILVPCGGESPETTEE
jgi:LysM repeat protein